MGARRKLNNIFMSGSLIIAGVFGLASGSVVVFLITAGILLALCSYSGDIRSGKRGDW